MPIEIPTPAISTAIPPQPSLTPVQIPPTLTSLPTPEVDPCLAQAGSIADDQITTGQMAKPLSYRIYLPPCFEPSGDQRYPVVYLLHGQGYTDDQWTRLGIGATADNLIDRHKIAPVIIVMPYDYDWRQPTESGFGDALVKSLVPWIDSHYPTRASRAYRAIGGLSRGAAWALHLGLSDWETFGAIGLHSLPIFWTDSELIPKWLDTIPTPDLPRLYLDVSAKDEDLQSNLDFEAMLNHRQIPHEWHLFVGYHDEAYWSAHIESYLLWYAQDWPLIN